MTTATADLPVYTASGVFTGTYIDEHEARRRIRAGEAWVTREGPKGRRLVSRKAEASGKRERALTERDPAGAAISATYEEPLYSRGTLVGPEKTAVVTNYCVTLKKARHYKNSGVFELVPFREAEGFRRRRFNPDLLPQPLVPVRRNHAIPASWQ